MSGSSGLAVAVIGAGAAGLCAARHLAAATKVLHCTALQVLYMCFLQGSVRPTVLEQSRRVGGTWVYTQDTGTDENGLPRYYRVLHLYLGVHTYHSTFHYECGSADLFLTMHHVQAL